MHLNLYYIIVSCGQYYKKSMTDLYEKVNESADYIRSLVKTGADSAIILGTGLGDFASVVKDQISIPYAEIPYFPTTTIQSHTGRLIFGYLSDIPVIVSSGRFHYYEGYSATELTFPVRVLKALGITHIIFTNAAGGINPHYTEGDLVLVDDHINLMPQHPLRGHNDERLGLRFPDMMQAYDKETNRIFKKLASELNIPIKSGVYLGLQGPSLETPAEYKMAHILGADLVGMSTIPEVIVARHGGMKVTVFSIVSNVCFPQSVLTETTVEDVISVVSKSAGKLQKLLNKYFEKVR
jgi:purine-nucleoside phosphorylase